MFYLLDMDHSTFQEFSSLDDMKNYMSENKDSRLKIFGDASYN